MQSEAASRSDAGLQSRRRTALSCGLIILAVSAAFLAFELPRNNIMLWDESRLAVNAIEMSQHGFSLITTYGFQPDLWNTKPPLLIWLMAGCIRLFGPEEWALRLPSFLAATATVALVMRFSWRLSGSAFVAVIATLTLLLSPGFFGGHAAMSGDYDALLTLFTTAYVLLLFETLHRRRPDAGRVIACGLLIAGACLTKGVAGLIPGVGVAAYVLIRGRLPRLFQTPWYAVAGFIVAGLVGGFYALREAMAHGYLTAVMYNEIGGRYLQGMGGHFQPPYYYLWMLALLFAFGPGFALPFAAGVLPWKRTKSAAFLVYANLVSLLLLLIYTVGRTKIYWYLVPIYPIISISFAISVRHIFALIAKFVPRLLWWRIDGPIGVRNVLAAIALVAIGVNAILYSQEIPPQLNNPQSHYGMVFASLSRQGIRHIRTIDGGVDNNDNLVDYTPQRRFYTLAWIGRGLDIGEDDPTKPLALTQGAALVTCDPRFIDQVKALGRSLTDIDDCAAVMPGQRSDG